MSASSPFAWFQGQVFERPSVLYSDGGLGLLCGGDTEEKLRDEQREQNGLETDPAHMIRFGTVRIKVLSIEDDAPPAPSEVRGLLERVRKLPRLSAGLKAEIDAVLARSET